MDNTFKPDWFAAYIPAIACFAAAKKFEPTFPGVTMARHDENELHTVDTTVTSRRPYSTPKLNALGSFAKLTRDAAKSAYTDMAAMDAMSNM